MFIRIRRRMAADDGVTVVETMVAIVVLTVALFGLMGTFIASATSQLDQRSRTAATRVATEYLETRRQVGFEKLKEDLTAGCPSGSTCAPQQKTVNGLTFDITPTVTEVDARDPSLGPQPGKPTVMQVRTDVTWTIRGAPKTLSSTTSVSPTKPDASKDIKSVTLFPNPTVVSARMSPLDTTTVEGIPTEDVVVSAELKGLDTSAPVTVRYTDDQGAKGPLTLTTTDQKIWKVTIPRLDIRKAIPADQEYGELAFLLEVGIGDGVFLRQEQTLLLARTTEPLSVLPERDTTFGADGQVVSRNVESYTFIQCPYESTSLKNCDEQDASRPYLPVYKGGAARGMNRIPTIFVAEVKGLKPVTGDKVEVWWQNAGTWVGPLKLSYYDTLGDSMGTRAGNTRWYVYLPDKGGWVFPFDTTTTGMPVDFWFIATRGADGQAANAIVRMNVRGT